MNLPELIVLDVGHGNCAILRDIQAITIIDCPRSPVLLKTLKRFDISAIDYLLISHADIDHIGGLTNLLKKGVVSAVPDTHIMCTQLSRKCAENLAIVDSSHLMNLPAEGYTSNMCCGGTISIQLNGKETTYKPSRTAHRAFVEDKVKVPTPLCLRHLAKLK